MSNKTPEIAYYAAGSHAAVKRAAEALAGADGRAQSAGPDTASSVVATDAGLPPRTFRIWKEAGKLYITGDRPRSVLAGALYWKHHVSRGAPPALPLERTSPYRNRLMLEDFPFHCYSTQGLDFDRRAYAENLVSLGFTSMECNRLSKSQPLRPHWENYYFSSPSMAPFVWTRWHEGVWDPAVVGANAAELRACVQTALDYDLEPSVTSFLPRPQPDEFFEKHPHLKGFYFHSELLKKGNHQGHYCIDTDHPEGMAFYKSVYMELLRANPELRHFFFWHSDLGTRFWPDGEGPGKRSRFERIAGFHEEFQQILAEAGVKAQVWLNPWHLEDVSLEKLDKALPAQVGYAVKENAYITHFCGTARARLNDLNVFSATLGDVPAEIKRLTDKSGRCVCMGQYLDFSEDLDPIMGAVHPLMTFRKFLTLDHYPHEASSANWGILSPEISACRVNQDVIREMVWGAPRECVHSILPLLFPAGLDAGARELAYDAWRKIDQALQAWPQYWGMRIQDSGLRLRWLVKPFLLECTPVEESLRNYYLNHQIYRFDSPTPFNDFMEITALQAAEASRWFGDMAGMLAQAEELLARALQAAQNARESDAAWITGQIPPTRWMRLFFETYKNLFGFHGLPERDTLTDAHRDYIKAEIANVAAILEHLKTASAFLIITKRGKWGHSFGPDIAGDFLRKSELLARVLETCGKPSAGARAPAEAAPSGKS